VTYLPLRTSFETKSWKNLGIEETVIAWDRFELRVDLLIDRMPSSVVDVKS